MVVFVDGGGGVWLVGRARVSIANSRETWTSTILTLIESRRYGNFSRHIVIIAHCNIRILNRHTHWIYASFIVHAYLQEFSLLLPNYNNIDHQSERRDTLIIMCGCCRDWCSQMYNTVRDKYCQSDTVCATECSITRWHCCVCAPHFIEQCSM